MATETKVQDLLVAMEFGYKQSEKGHNIQMATSELLKVMQPNKESKKPNSDFTDEENGLIKEAIIYFKSVATHCKPDGYDDCCGLNVKSKKFKLSCSIVNKIEVLELKKIESGMNE